MTIVKIYDIILLQTCIKKYKKLKYLSKITIYINTKLYKIPPEITKIKTSKIKMKIKISKKIHNVLSTFTVLTIITSTLISTFANSPKAFATNPPEGSITEVNCSFITGWAWDKDLPNTNITIVLTNGPYNGNNVLNILSADKNPKKIGIDANVIQNIKNKSGNGEKYGFFSYLPSSIRNSFSHTIYAYALDAAAGSSSVILGTKIVKCPSGNSSITNNFNSKPITITTTDRLAGAIDSLKYDGKEFVNSYDHGRQIQYAMQTGQGECYNPTEAGSYNDDIGQNTTSILKNLTKPNTATLQTENSPAFWLAPDSLVSIFCTTGQTKSTNTALTSPHTMYKQIQIGHSNMSNVIKMDLTVDIKSPSDTLLVEIPAIYLDSSFSKLQRYDPKTDKLTTVVEDPIYKKNIFSYAKSETTPVLLSTPDGKHAMANYSPSASKNRHISYSLSKYVNVDPKKSTNTMTITANEHFTNVGQKNFQSFMVVGTVDEVKASMKKLYLESQSDTQLPQGYFDGASCSSGFGGWAWDSKNPTKSIDVELYSVDKDGKETIVGTPTANQENIAVSKLVSYGNTKIGFYLPMPNNLKDGVERKIYARAKNSQPSNININPPIPGMVKIKC